MEKIIMAKIFELNIAEKDGEDPYYNYLKPTGFTQQKNFDCGTDAIKREIEKMYASVEAHELFNKYKFLYFTETNEVLLYLYCDRDNRLACIEKSDWTMVSGVTATDLDGSKHPLALPKRAKILTAKFPKRVKLEKIDGRGYSGGHNTAGRLGWGISHPTPPSDALAWWDTTTSGNWTGYYPSIMVVLPNRVEW